MVLILIGIISLIALKMMGKFNEGSLQTIFIAL
jgi:hypothetical protein